MSRRSHTIPGRTLVRSAAAYVLAIGALTGCGESVTVADSDPVRGLSSVTVTGELGSAPTVKWDGRLNVTRSETKVLVKGSGDVIKDGDVVLSQIWIGNGYTKSMAFDSFASQAQPVTLSKETTKPLTSALEGQPLGSRVMVAATAKEAFGEQGNPQLGIGNKDSVLFVVDSIDIVRDEPDGKQSALPAWMPKLVTKDGTITGWDFSKAQEPDGKLRVVPIITGDGPKVGKDSTIVTRYLGQVFDAAKPFDEAYSKPEPATFKVDGLVKGWQQGLAGVPAGSRVAIVVPPALGYGAKGNESAKIKGTDTLYFVLDVLATS
ncbi:MAG: FKBP-type peptidyl-prolyl cis-trans isomerase [Nocardioides sp.]